MRQSRIFIESLALACLLTWFYLLFWSPSAASVFASHGLSDVGARIPFHFFSFLGSCLAYVLLKKTSFALNIADLIAFAAAAVLTFSFLSNGDDSISGTFFLAKSSVLGFLYAAMLISLWLRIGRGDSNRLMIAVGLQAIFEGILSETALAVLFGSALTVFIAALPLLSLSLILLDDRILKEKNELIPEEAAQGGCLGREGALLPLAILFFGTSVAFNLFQMLCRSGEPFVNFHNGVSMVAAGLALFACGKFLDVKSNCLFLVVAPFILESTCFLSALLLGFSFNGFYLLAMFAHTFLFYCSFVAGKCFLGDGKLVFPVLIATNEGAGLLSQFLSEGITSLGGQSVVALASLYVFLVAACSAIPWLASMRAKQKNGEPSLQDQSDTARKDAVMVKLIDEYGLSPREAEVVELLGEGYNAARVSEILFISRETARTHVKNIYKKMDVHSHQELIDLFHLDRASKE